MIIQHFFALRKGANLWYNITPELKYSYFLRLFSRHAASAPPYVPIGFGTWFSCQNLTGTPRRRFLAWRKNISQKISSI